MTHYCSDYILTRVVFQHVRQVIYTLFRDISDLGTRLHLSNKAVDVLRQRTETVRDDANPATAARDKVAMGEAVGAAAVASAFKALRAKVKRMMVER